MARHLNLNQPTDKKETKNTKDKIKNKNVTSQKTKNKKT